jgi:hypothetical protein
MTSKFAALFVFMAYLAAAQAALLRAQAHRETASSVICSVDECAHAINCRIHGIDGDKSLPPCNVVQRSHPDVPYDGLCLYSEMQPLPGVWYNCMGIMKPTVSPTMSPTISPTNSPTLPTPAPTNSPTSAPTIRTHWWDVEQHGDARLRLKWLMNGSKDQLFKLDPSLNSPNNVYDLKVAISNTHNVAIEKVRTYYMVGVTASELNDDVKMFVDEPLVRSYVLDFEQASPYNFCNAATNKCDPITGRGQYVHTETASMGVVYWCNTDRGYQSGTGSCPRGLDPPTSN